MSSIQIDPSSNTLKYIQLVDVIVNSINEGTLAEGDMLPSVNALIKDASLSRDTVFKAYSELKSRGVIESVPNRGYFVSRKMKRVLLFLDTFKAYKEVLYDGFRDNLPDSVNVDLMFHHYNAKVFESIVNDSIGKYSHYIVMSFDHPGVKRVIKTIPSEKLLIIDWNIHADQSHSYVCQDFEQSIYDNFSENIQKIRKYKRFVYLYPEKWTYHPGTSISNFERFCEDHLVEHEVLFDPKKLDVRKGDLYLLVSDRTLMRIIDQAEERELKLGQDVGVISYNETPMKKYIKDGITVISTDFTKMGELAAKYVMSTGEMKEMVPTKLIIRNSF